MTNFIPPNECIFHIIYMPGTVKYLHFFARSLLRWSSFSFRLVANGCSNEEKKILQQLCDNNDRLEFIALPTIEIMPHGQALNYLQALNSSNYFCFMDSDIFATADLSSITDCLTQYDATFYYPSICWKKVINNTSYNGIPLSCTYFAIYNQKSLSRFIHSTGIGFDKYHWSKVPKEFQDKLTKAGFHRKGYDTGKLLYFLWLIEKQQFRFIESLPLLHLGGVSCTNYPLPIKAFGRLGKVVRWLPQGRIRERFIEWGEIRRLKNGNKSWSTERALKQRNKKKDKRTTSVYFGELIDALMQKRLLPPTPTIVNIEMKDEIDYISQKLVELYDEFGCSL